MSEQEAERRNKLLTEFIITHLPRVAPEFRGPLLSLAIDAYGLGYGQGRTDERDAKAEILA